MAGYRKNNQPKLIFACSTTMSVEEIEEWRERIVFFVKHALPGLEFLCHDMSLKVHVTLPYVVGGWMLVIDSEDRCIVYLCAYLSIYECSCLLVKCVFDLSAWSMCKR